MSIVTVHALSTGSLTLPERFFITPSDPEAERMVPSLSFLVQHQSQDKLTRLVFDLGLRRDVNLYPTALQKHCATRSPMTTNPDVVASLAAGGLSVDDIDYVLFSHVHYDHVGLPSDFSNPKTKFVVGPGAFDLLGGKIKLHGNHSVFEHDLLPLDRTIELPSVSQEANGIVTPQTSDHSGRTKTGSVDNIINTAWASLSPFTHAIDLFSDGTVYILSAPGHLPGHINLLCRTAPDKFVILAGDACHDMRLFTGERDIATWTDNEGRQCCIHADIPTAKQTIQNLAKVQKEGLEIDGRKAEVEVVFAHNWEWEVDAQKRGRFWPGQL